MSSFSSDMAIAKTKALQVTDRAVKNTILRMCKEVINETPVDTGRLKNNWYASNRAFGVRTTKATDPSGKNSMNRVRAALKRLKRGQSFYFFNNLVYAPVVEFGRYPNPPKNPTGKTINGFSRQAPQGMLRKNFNLVELYFAQQRGKF
jgi:hypothetical protein